MNPQDSHNLLQRALAAHQHGDLIAAEAFYRQVLANEHEHPQALAMLGTLLVQKQQIIAGEKLLERAIELKPDYVVAINNLALSRGRRGQLAEAVSLWERAIRHDPGDAQLHLNVGAALDRLNQLKEAAEHFHRATALRPDYVRAYGNLGVVLMKLGRMSEARRAHEQALRLQPANPDILDMAALQLQAEGRISQSIDYWQRAIATGGASPAIHSNLLFGMHYDPRFSPRELFEAHVDWAARYATPLSAQIRAHGNNRTSGRPLRIGYVSADFRRHAVATFIEPILAHHDRTRFEIACYSSVISPDEVTGRLKTYADAWHDVTALDDAALAEKIRADAIDILVDLSGHIGNHRLLAFARKPAPVQVTYLGYPDTTGISTIDYRLTDARHDPAGATEQFHVETLVRLEPSAWCYRPDAGAPPVNPPPSQAAGIVTFGSLNNIFKTSEPAARLWAEILCRMPGSRLLLLALGGEEAAAVTVGHLQEHGVARERIEVVGKVLPAEYLRVYHRIDIAFDPFPYNGHTTTLDSLWMGVPVITLAGHMHVSRAGVSVLSTLGLPELIASDDADYIEKAVALAGDRVRLAEYRATLRDRMASSPLRDEAGFARHLESVYNGMWTAWLAGRKMA